MSRMRQLCTNISKERDSLTEQNANLLKYLQENNAPQHSGISISNPKTTSERRGTCFATTPSTDRSNKYQSQSTTSYSSRKATNTRRSQDRRTQSHQDALDYDGKSVDAPVVPFSPTSQYYHTTFANYTLDQAIGVEFVSTYDANKLRSIRNKQDSRKDSYFCRIALTTIIV